MDRRPEDDSTHSRNRSGRADAPDAGRGFLGLAREVLRDPKMLVEHPYFGGQVIVLALVALVVWLARPLDMSADLAVFTVGLGVVALHTALAALTRSELESERRIGRIASLAISTALVVAGITAIVVVIVVRLKLGPA